MLYSFMVPTVVAQTPNDLLREHNTYEEIVGKEDILCQEFSKIHEYMQGGVYGREASRYMYMPRKSEVQQGDGTRERDAPQDDDIDDDDFSGDQTSVSSLHSSPSSLGDPAGLMVDLERRLNDDDDDDEFF